MGPCRLSMPMLDPGRSFQTTHVLEPQQTILKPSWTCCLNVCCARQRKGVGGKIIQDRGVLHILLPGRPSSATLLLYRHMLLQSASIHTVSLAAHTAPAQANAAAAAHGRRSLSSARAPHRPELCVPSRGGCPASSGGHLRTSLAGLQLQRQAQVGGMLPAEPICILRWGTSSASGSDGTGHPSVTGAKCSCHGDGDMLLAKVNQLHRPHV